MKKTLALLLAAAMTATLTACGGGGGATTQTADNHNSAAAGETADKSQAALADAGRSVVNVGISADVPSLDPYYGSSVGGLTVLPEIFQFLFDRTEFGGDIYPVIGKEYVMDVDALTISVTLFDYVKDSKGNDIKADDVKFCYEKAFESGQFNKIAQYIDTLEVVDDYTLIFHLNDVKLGLEEDILAGVWICDKDEYDVNTFTTAPVGTGPYVVKEYISGSSLTLEKNKNFWQKDELNPANYKANVDVINFKIILEAAQMSIALETGDIDLADSVSYNELTSYFADAEGNAKDGYTVNSINMNLFNNMSFCMSDESNVGNDLKLRQAILYAIDSAGLVQGVLSGAGAQCYTWGADVYGDYLKKWESEDYYNYNLDKAKECLAASDYAKNGSPTLRIIMESNDARKAAAEMIQAYLLAVGINSEINVYDSALFASYRYEYDQWDILLDNQANSAYLAGVWANYFVNGIKTWKGQEVTYNGLNDDKLTELAKKAASLDGHTEENVDAFHQYLKENAIAYGLWAATKYQVGQKGIIDIFMDGKMYLKPGACTYADDYVSRSAK